MVLPSGEPVIGHPHFSGRPATPGLIDTTSKDFDILDFLLLGLRPQLFPGLHPLQVQGYLLLYLNEVFILHLASKGRFFSLPSPFWPWRASRGWRRYQREVLWYTMGTKKSQRSVLGARLVARLTGPARLLAMSWSLEELSGTHGARNLLSKLEQSPLVRKQLPNTAAVLQLPPPGAREHQCLLGERKSLLLGGAHGTTWRTPRSRWSFGSRSILFVL